MTHVHFIIGGLNIANFWIKSPITKVYSQPIFHLIQQLLLDTFLCIKAFCCSQNILSSRQLQLLSGYMSRVCIAKLNFKIANLFYSLQQHRLLVLPILLCKVHLIQHLLVQVTQFTCVCVCVCVCQIIRITTVESSKSDDDNIIAPVLGSIVGVIVLVAVITGIVIAIIGLLYHPLLLYTAQHICLL